MTLFSDMPYVANDEQMETLENGQVSKLQLLNDLSEKDLAKRRIWVNSKPVESSNVTNFWRRL